MKKHYVIFCLGLLGVMALSFPVGEAIGRHYSQKEDKCMSVETDCVSSYDPNGGLSVDNYARLCIQQREECESK